MTNYSVHPALNGGWRVRKDGNQKDILLTSSKGEAMGEAIRCALPDGKVFVYDNGGRLDYVVDLGE